MGDIAALIAKLKAATGGSRELDHEIASAVGHAKQVVVNGDPDIAYDPPYPNGGPRCNPVRYTTNIDAALTIVPFPAQVNLTMTHSTEQAYCAIWRNRRYADCAPDHDHIRATPAIAICIAALKVRAP